MARMARLESAFGMALALLAPAMGASAQELAAGVSAGAQHACALNVSGGVRCWGSNLHGALGDGTTTQSGVPVAVSGLSSGVAAVAAGGLSTCALTTGGGVDCWGDNSYGELGDGTTTDRHTAVAVSGLSSGVTAIMAGFHRSCALTSGGGVKCWGFLSTPARSVTAPKQTAAFQWTSRSFRVASRPSPELRLIAVR